MAAQTTTTPGFRILASALLGLPASNFRGAGSVSGFGAALGLTPFDAMQELEDRIAAAMASPDRTFGKSAKRFAAD